MAFLCKIINNCEPKQKKFEKSLYVSQKKHKFAPNFGVNQIKKPHKTL